MKTLYVKVFFIAMVFFGILSCGNSGDSKTITQEKTNVSHLGKVTFVELGASTCKPCQMMQKVMLEMEKKYSNRINIVFYDINTIAGKPYAYQYGIRVIPTQVFLDTNGNEYFRHEGYFPLEQIESILKLKGIE